MHERVKPRLLTRLDKYLAKRPESKILDIGIGDASHALDLAQRGHDVTGITVEQSEHDIAVERSNQLKLGRGACQFMVLDATQIMQEFEPASFDVVLAHNVFHHLEKPDTAFAIESMQHVTRSLGINAIGGYVIDASANVSETSQRRMFRHGELARHYQAPTWDIVYNLEDTKTIVRSHQGRELVSSHTDLIAQKK